jgi:hypothetical protein
MARNQERQELDNAGIAELLAIEGDAAKPPLQKAFRRVAQGVSVACRGVATFARAALADGVAWCRSLVERASR